MYTRWQRATKQIIRFCSPLRYATLHSTMPKDDYQANENKRVCVCVREGILYMWQSCYVACVDWLTGWLAGVFLHTKKR